LIQPVLKWAGGKSQLLAELGKYFPMKYKRYFEPFIGGGAVFFHIAPRNGIISDANVELVNTYKVIAEHPSDLLKVLRRMQQLGLTDDLFYRIRDEDPEELSSTERAARMIFLNKTCYNGLYRVNREGKFNVPFGKYEKMPKLFDESNILGAGELLRSTKIEQGYYNFVLRQYNAGEGDFVYLDPPYAVDENANGFTSYTKELFNWAEQERLAKEFSRLVESGCHVMLSNSDTPEIRKLYAGEAKAIITVKADRMINSNGKKRTGFTELIILGYIPDARDTPTLRNWIRDDS
jgi:DNA adenine methylase